MECHVVLFDTYSPNYRELDNIVTTRITILVATENWTILVATRIVILVATENCPILCCDEIYFSLFSFCADFLEN